MGRRTAPQASAGEGWGVAATKKADSKADAKKAAPAKGAGKSGGKGK